MKKIQKGNFQGLIQIPASKSDSQRALVLAAHAQGTSTLLNFGKSEDELAVLSAIQVLGAKVELLDNRTLQITGISQIPSCEKIHLNESGLGIRLLIPMVALYPRSIQITASGSLLKRPLEFYDQILPKLNVEIRSNNGYAPIQVQGPMQGDSIEIEASLSSQFLSGLLYSLPFAAKDSSIFVKNLASKPYISMTLNTLRKFAIEVKNENFERFEIKGEQKAKACTYEIEGDWSAASFWLVASALGLKIQVKGLNENSLQADRAILVAFEAANCSLIWNENTLSINGKKRTSFTFDATDCPDLFPPLAVLGALTTGISKIKGVHRLIHKESNRAFAIQNEFSKLGIQTQIVNDELHLYGATSIKGNKVFSHNDHRIAMALAIIALFSEEEVEIEQTACVAKSYPDFWKDLDSLR